MQFPYNMQALPYFVWSSSRQQNSKNASDKFRKTAKPNNLHMQLNILISQKSRSMDA